MPFPDYEEFIAALNGRGVRYLVIGAYAVAFHARPRATRDRPEGPKIEPMCRSFGGPEVGFSEPSDPADASEGAAEPGR